jgi:CxxC motif-containing protein (DUF1111 family)
MDRFVAGSFMRTTRMWLVLSPLVVTVLAWSLGWPVAADDHAQHQDVPLGEPLPGLTRDQLRMFLEGKDVFEEAEFGEDGLGPIFNEVGCGTCHFSGAIGGASEIVETRAASYEDGIYREFPGGSLFQSKAIRADCSEKVPPRANVRTLRQTQPLFGSGLIEAIPDAQIHAYAAAQAATHPEQAGRVHYVRDAASGQMRIGRFGWKSQQATLLTFSGDAYVNEMGITTPMFPDENAPNGDMEKLAACDTVAEPEDDGFDLVLFSNFMRLLAPPPRADGPVVDRGQQTFENIGCAVCHYSGYRAESPIGAIDGRLVGSFSDLLLHDAGTGDGIVQGEAQGHELRTAPLWGLSVSGPYLHDGSARTIEEAILRHANQAARARNAFQALSPMDKEELLEFLGSI